MSRGLRAGLFLIFVLGLAGAASASITAIWANDGGDKVTQDELRATLKKGTVLSRVWDGTRISIFGGRNEVVAFNVILEAAQTSSSRVQITFNSLRGPAGSSIVSSGGNDVFNWVQRPIELFYVRYLQIKGVSAVSYELYDERHVPIRMRRPWSGEGIASGTWLNRPDHDKFYPDIAVPMELVPSFTIAAAHNQSVWVDVYIPKSALPGVYTGTLTVQEANLPAKSIPVQLRVFDLTLPDTPTAKTMVYISASDINRRYTGQDSVTASSANGIKARLVRDRHFLLAHRHRISLIGDTPDNCNSTADQPCAEWGPRLDGSLFTASNGYDGPGVNVGNNVYAIGTYGTWSWKTGTEADMRAHTNAWATWFEQNPSRTDYFLYLADESANTSQTQTWAKWISNNPGPGNHVRSMATLPLTTAVAQTPSLDIPTSTLEAGDPSQWQPDANRYTSDPRKEFYMYNGHRPATGSFAIEDDGVALRELAWAQYKMHINRWFFWESTYYNNYQGNTGQVNVFETAQTFGNNGTNDPIKGQAGWEYSNGDGVLMYPGTDMVYPSDSYGVEGPFASLRMKQWRRGIQDVEYLSMAATVSPQKTQAVINALVPKALWEYGVSDASDPTWVRTDISWPTDPDVWETARAQLATIVAGASSQGSPPSANFNNVRVYPNPWRKDRHAGFPVTIDHLPANCTVKIFTVAAHLVRTLTTGAGGSVTWDLKNDSGDNVASGIYLYLAQTSDDQSAHGKFAVIQ